MQYNTQQKRMPLPEYGRSIQNMVDHALTIEDRAERQRCANTIINIMGNMFPHLRDVPDFKHKLWDHLAIMANFQLDIDYPYEIIRKDNLNTKPERASPFFNISLVEDTLREILKIVVNNSIVGKDAISRTSLAKSELKSTTIATRILIASRISSSHEGIEIMKNNTAASRYIPINRSFFLIFIISLLSI